MMDPGEFDALYASCATRITGQVYALTGDLPEAQDCVQEAFVRAWAQRGRLDAAQSPEAYVRRAAFRLAVSRWRSARSLLRAYTRHGSEVVAPPMEHLTLERERVVSALSRVSLEHRQVLVLHYLCDLSVEVVASELGVPVSTVKTRLHRGRKAVSVLLVDEDLLEVCDER